MGPRYAVLLSQSLIRESTLPFPLGFPMLGWPVGTAPLPGKGGKGSLCTCTRSGGTEAGPDKGDHAFHLASRSPQAEAGSPL